MIKLFESFTDIKEVKNNIFLKAIQTGEIDIIQFFLEKGYDINGDDFFSEAVCQKDEILRYLLEKGVEVESNRNIEYYLKTLDVQKALIDFGYELFIYDNVGFNPNLSNDPDYAHVVEMTKDMKKYNM